MKFRIIFALLAFAIVGGWYAVMGNSPDNGPVAEQSAPASITPTQPSTTPTQPFSAPQQ